MIKKCLCLFLLILFFFVPPLSAKDDVLKDPNGQRARDIREFFIDEKLRRLALENTRAKREREKRLALQELALEEASREIKLSSATGKPRFFFIPRNLRAANVLPERKAPKRG